MHDNGLIHGDLTTSNFMLEGSSQSLVSLAPTLLHAQQTSWCRAVALYRGLANGSVMTTQAKLLSLAVILCIFSSQEHTTVQQRLNASLCIAATCNLAGSKAAIPRVMQLETAAEGCKHRIRTHQSS